MISSSNLGSTPLLEVVVTARPSWARVKHLVFSYGELAGHDKVRLTLVGPAVSQRYGDISKKLPEWLKYDIVPALNVSPMSRRPRFTTTD